MKVNRRLDAKLSVDGLFSGRISSVPWPLSFGSSVAPTPKKSRRMSLSAIVCPASTLMVVDLLFCVASLRVGVNAT